MCTVAAECKCKPRRICCLSPMVKLGRPRSSSLFFFFPAPIHVLSSFVLLHALLPVCMTSLPLATSPLFSFCTPSLGPSCFCYFFPAPILILSSFTLVPLLLPPIYIPSHLYIPHCSLSVPLHLGFTSLLLFPSSNSRVVFVHARSSSSTPRVSSPSLNSSSVSFLLLHLSFTSLLFFFPAPILPPPNATPILGIGQAPPSPSPPPCASSPQTLPPLKTSSLQFLPPNSLARQNPHLLRVAPSRCQPFCNWQRRSW